MPCFDGLNSQLLRQREPKMADFLSPSERSALMSRVRGKNTQIERIMFAELERRGLKFVTHSQELTGSPDILIEESRLLVFIDGDFWHGRRYEACKSKLADSWSLKIESNIRRDRRQRRRLRSQGWHVMRLWGSEVLKNSAGCANRVLAAHDRIVLSGIDIK